MENQYRKIDKNNAQRQGKEPPKPKREPLSGKETMSPEMIRLEKKKRARKEMLLNNLKRVGSILIVVAIISGILASIAISCINDVLALKVSPKSDKEVVVEIEPDMDTAAVIKALDKAGVIRNAWFCKLAAKFIGYKDEGYIAGKYTLHRSMGLENMLNTIKNLVNGKAKTVTLTFPEGYTADQIIEALVKEKVCSKDDLMECINNFDFASEFKFLKSRRDLGDRYNPLEGFLFPDTYEFYIGENADSVIRKFLTNFNEKWTDDYEKLAEKRKMTADQIVKIASIVEKEAMEADMATVGSIIFNRLDAGMRLECNSTRDYISSNKSGLTESQVASYNSLYNTYECDELPVGAICNPGVNAIEAILNAPETDYYYFIHDKNNEFHAAKTLREQQNNIARYGINGSD